MKLLGPPRQLCKACLRHLNEALESEWAYVCLGITFVCVALMVLFGWIIYRDPCFQWEIRTQLCDDYHNGLIAGAFCYDLCVERVSFLSSCVDQQGNLSVFRWNKFVIKAERPNHKKEGEKDELIWEGMKMQDLAVILDDFLRAVLGVADHSKLIERVIQHADFNHDSVVSFGEIRSLWHLLHIPEFRMLFIFNESSVFPTLNGSCGTMYAVEETYQPYLYRENKSFVEKVFSTRHRWGLPDFPQRAHISLGLLEYAYTVREHENVKYYMCTFSPDHFGHTEYFEMKVSTVDGLVSEAVLNASLMQRNCDSDTQCVYGDVCKTSCDRVTRKCSGIPENYIPDVVRVCTVLQEYVLFNVPVKLKSVLSKLVADCVRLGKKSRFMDPDMMAVEENVLLDRLKQVLWDELKYADTKWLEKSTPKPQPVNLI
ncbi:hypothetical protein DPMN_149680 [Dreissena polymorpha]|uniref:EF-hand domain-containing protein n=2 Tax=Dreissena polymorpha TaxID=45954 RepID=A0A9D4J578_DREPO|nr:hypothetical protein DPMN_149680 [Dreissena polymorpha]